MDLTSKTKAELNAMTKTQLVDALIEDRQETKTVVSQGDRRGQIREVRETRDVAGNLLGSQEVNWTYWPNGNVDTITMTEKDKNGVLVGKPQVVKHGKSGGLETSKNDNKKPIKEGKT